MANKRIFKSHFFNNRGKLVKVTRSCSVVTAAMHAATKLSQGTYGAASVEILHAETEKLHASITCWGVRKQLHIEITLHK